LEIDCHDLPQQVNLIAHVFAQVITFDIGALPEDATEEQLQEAAVFRDTYLHLSSLLHATALQALCKEDDGRNLVIHNSLHQTPKEDARQEELESVQAQHMGMASWQDLFVLRGRALSTLSVLTQRPAEACPSHSLMVTRRASNRRARNTPEPSYQPGSRHLSIVKSYVLHLCWSTA
jgi:hypothetical protein